MRKGFLSFYKPSIDDQECEAVTEVLKSFWLTTGPKTKIFEEKFSQQVNAQGALGLNSCTAGLFLGLKALGVGPGDEVITTPLTFCATANVIEHLGATTVLADVDPESWLLSPEAVKTKVTERTKVIVPVHYAGQVVNMKALNALGHENDVQILEDAAHCLPSSYEDGTPVGSGQNLCAFSFYANKNMTTGEGGMLVGPSELVDQCRSLSLHGLDKDAWKRFDKKGSWRYDIKEPGYKYNMTDVQAALGLVQMSKLPQFHKRRKELSKLYRQELESLKEIQLLPYEENSSFHIFPIVLRPEECKIPRDTFIEKLKEKNIGTSVHYLPLHSFTYYKNKYSWLASDFPVASRIGEQCITLPMYPAMSDLDVKDVVLAIKSVIAEGVNA